MPCITFGMLMKRQRERLNMKQMVLARLIFASQSTISRIESGRQNPSIDQLYLICKYLKISLDKFFATYKKS